MNQNLDKFKSVFNKPQHRNSSTYITGLIACEGKKNIKNINNTFTEHRDQSTLNRFRTEPSWSLKRLEEKRLKLARGRLPMKHGSPGTLIIDDTITKKTGKHMEYTGVLRLYVKRETCVEERLRFRTKIQLVIEQIQAFKAPPGTNTMVAFDSWYFCSKVVEAACVRGFDWVTQAKSNRVVKWRGARMNVTELAESLPEGSFRNLWIGRDMYCVRGFRVWMNGGGRVRLVVSREDDGFHFIVSNRVGWSERRVVSAYRRRQLVEVYIRDVRAESGAR